VGKVRWPRGSSPQSASTTGVLSSPDPRRRRLITSALAALGTLAGCTRQITIPDAAPTTGHRSPPKPRELHASDFAKTDVDSAVEIVLQESLASARLLTEKLYRRNPREWHRGGYASLQAAVDRAFDAKFDWRFPELDDVRGIAALELAFRTGFSGDRVFAFGVGMGSMIMQAYGDRTEFFVIDRLDPQKLYNAARNVEVAAWKLSTARDAEGRLLLLSNDIGRDGVQNLSYEREIGKLIALQDALARIIAERTNRSIRFVVQGVAMKVFLPI
jgi:hypothetical protein